MKILFISEHMNMPFPLLFCKFIVAICVHIGSGNFEEQRLCFVLCHDKFRTLEYSFCPCQGISSKINHSLKY
jgi:hypothetical protein